MEGTLTEENVGKQSHIHQTLINQFLSWIKLFVQAFMRKHLSNFEYGKCSS